MTDSDEREALRKRREELLAQLVAASEGVRTIDDAAMQEATVNLGRLKVSVAKLIKEQRDLQEDILRNTNQVTHHKREAKDLADRPAVAEEHHRAAAKFEEVGKALAGQLLAFSLQAEELVDEVRRVEYSLNAVKRARLIVATMDCMANTKALVSKLELAIGADEKINVQFQKTLEEEVRSLEARVKLLRDAVDAAKEPVEVPLEIRDDEAQK